MRFLFAVALLILSGLSENCQASDWRYVDSTKDYTAELTADVSSIRRTGDEARIWSKWIYDEPYNDGVHDEPYLVAMEQYSFRCFAREKALVSFIFYADVDMTEIKHHGKAPGELTWYDVVPDSIHENLMELACGDSDEP